MKVAAFTGGHSFDREAFAGFLDSLPCDVDWIEQPEAIDYVIADGWRDCAVSLHYDMPGVRPEPVAPPTEYVAAMAARTAAGKGFVVMHHAMASWPAWPGWAELIGGAYLYRRGDVRGEAWPDSGYRMEVPETISVVMPEHPVVAGLPPTFAIEDETYVCPVFEDDVIALLRTDAPIDDSVHFSSENALAGKLFDREGWSHPRGSSLAAWTRMQDASRVVYIQPGDTGLTLGDANYRRLMANAVQWAAEPALAGV